MGFLTDTLNKAPKAFLALSALSFVAACGGSGSGETSIAPLQNISEGAVINVDGQSFYVSDIAEDQSTITVMAYIEGFTQSVNVATVTLVKSSSDGLYYFSTASLSIVYNPTSGSLTWTTSGSPSVNTLMSEISNSGNRVDQTDRLAALAGNNLPDTDNDGIVDPLDTDDDGDGVADSSDAFPLDASESLDTDGDGTGNNTDTDDDGDGVADNYDSDPLNSAIASVGYAKNVADAAGVSFLPSVSGTANWGLGNPSSANVGSLISNLEVLAASERASIISQGYTPRFALNFSYDDFNVAGLEGSHNAGWTGLGSNIYIIDGFDGNAGLFYDVSGSDVYLTHGANTFGITWLVAPEADYHLIESFSSDLYSFDISSVSAVNSTESFSSFTGRVDTNADAANVSLGVHLTDGSSLTSSLVGAASFVTSTLQPIANSLPNAVIVESAGNNGAVTALSSARNCVAWGGRNSASSCTDVLFALNDQYYDDLDRTIFVGSYDNSTNDLASYSVSAGLAADHFIVADGTSPFDTGIGTSYAAPRVTGAIGLISQKFPSLSAQDRKGLILDTATDLGASGVDGVYGHGLLNVTNALNPLGMLR